MGAAKTVQRKIREAQGEMTHRAFAKKLGISLGSLARLRNSPQNVTLLTISAAHCTSHHQSSWTKAILGIGTNDRLVSCGPLRDN